MWLALTGVQEDKCDAGGDIVKLELDKSNKIKYPTDGCVYFGGNLTWYVVGQVGDRVDITFSNKPNNPPNSSGPFAVAPGSSSPRGDYSINVQDPTGARDATGLTDQPPPDPPGYQDWHYKITWFRGGNQLDQLDPMVKIRHYP
jgi:hypothetical protein